MYWKIPKYPVMILHLPNRLRGQLFVTTHAHAMLGSDLRRHPNSSAVPAQDLCRKRRHLPRFPCGLSSDRGMHVTCADYGCQDGWLRGLGKAQPLPLRCWDLVRPVILKVDKPASHLLTPCRLGDCNRGQMLLRRESEGTHHQGWWMSLSKEDELLCLGKCWRAAEITVQTSSIIALPCNSFPLSKSLLTLSMNLHNL